MKKRQDPMEPEELRANYERSLDALFEKDRLSQFGRVVKGLIHNINGPLQNLSMLVEMLSKGQDQLDGLALSRPEGFSEKWEGVSSKQRQRFQRLTQQISLLAGILRDFMVLLDIERNQSRVDLNLIIEKMASVFQADLFFKHDVEMDLQLERGLPLASIHGRDIIPALMHLFQNAITALREAPQKKLTIECLRESEEFIRIVFRDSGCGPGAEPSVGDRCDLFYSNWPETVIIHEHGEKHFGFGLYAVRQLLGPYGVEFRLERDLQVTEAILKIPIQPRKLLAVEPFEAAEQFLP